MKNIKFLIVITSIITVILIFAIIILNLNTNNNVASDNYIVNNQNKNNSLKNNTVNNNTITNSTNNSVNNDSVDFELKVVENREDFYTAKSCVEKYINYIVNGDNEAVYNVLDDAYINQNNINKNNIFQIVQKLNNNQIFTPIKMKFIEIDNKQIYTVYGNIREDKLNERANEIEFNITVILNKLNNTFSVIPGILNVETSYNAVGKNNKNTNNSYSIVNIDNKTMANIYFINYKTELLNNLQNAYNLLNEEYREKRYNNFAKFQEYINTNMQKINKMNLVKYSVQKYDDYTIYTCINQYNEYYIFIETAVMQYTVMLDDYTIETNEYISNYNSLSMQEKIEFNIKKFIKMINLNDYESAYYLLSDGFKVNYFPTLNDFENYIKNNFYEYSNVTFDEYTTEGEIVIYKVKIHGVQNNRDVVMNKTMIMKLGTDTDFEMSFDV